VLKSAGSVFVGTVTTYALMRARVERPLWPVVSSGQREEATTTLIQLSDDAGHYSAVIKAVRLQHEASTSRHYLPPVQPACAHPGGKLSGCCRRCQSA